MDIICFLFLRAEKKDVYYYKRICDEQNFNRWVSDLHFKVILLKMMNIYLTGMM